MIKLHSLKTLALAVLAVILTTGTLNATLSVYSFNTSTPVYPNQSCTLSIGVSYYYQPLGWSGTINWGDGHSDSVTGYSSDLFYHTYIAAGNYTIGFSGNGSERLYHSGTFGNYYYTYYTNSIGSGIGVSVLPAPPSFTLQPTNQVLFPGSNAVFSATVASSVPLSLQWLQNGTNLVSATNASLTVSNVQVSSEGAYSLLATNAGGTNVSSSAVLVVRRPLNIIFAGFSTTNTYRLNVANADSSAIDPLRVSTISILTKTNLSPTVSWQPLGIPPSLINGVLQLEATNQEPIEVYFQAVETP